MYRIFDAKLLIRLVIAVYFVFVAIVGAAYFFVTGAPISEIWLRVLGLSTTLSVTALIFFANNVCFFRVVWGLYMKIDKEAYPDISGNWKVELQSNYPVYLAMAEAATDKDTSFDVFSPIDVDKIERKKMSGTAKIKVTFLDVSVKTSFDDGVNPSSESITLVASPIKKVNGTTQHQLTYVYMSKRRDTPSDDDSEHYGAAWIDLTGDANNLVLEGYYWTKRNWRRAGNTAGRITFTRAAD
ncbi:MAG: hypothetical protein ABGX84_08435 [Alcanivorax sp.]|tara:strand:+ start:4048 stop:4770 length:723 start_codon:yes stop_codon:yes gene_type:complete